MKKYWSLVSILLLLLALSACGPAATTAPTEVPPTNTAPAPTEAPQEPTLAPAIDPTATSAEGYPAPTQAPVSGYPAPTQAPVSGYPGPTTPAEPVALTFPSSDGTILAGTFYPPMAENAPVVVLMHQFGSDQHQWDDLASWLQTGTPPAGNEWLPLVPGGQSFGVFTFDFRGHGESEGDKNSDAGLLLDAQSAVAFAKTQPGVDPLRVITIGTSIGADRALDACIALNEGAIAEAQESQGCLGAMAISPGSFVGVNYTNAANAFLSEPHLGALYCVASESDGSSPVLCNSVTNDRYVATIYPGSAHGMSLLAGGLDPQMGELILTFLNDSLQLRQ